MLCFVEPSVFLQSLGMHDILRVIQFGAFEILGSNENQDLSNKRNRYVLQSWIFLLYKSSQPV